ncbi:MAG: magnesium/cobalt efflux protein [Cytophagales bacterium CG12_big_fil_rev_8_21_14_0_65_40_12]|nr:MAG: magnesium/cobalt efflux protein [Cytophagales bacterium CG12_big_fil_rev_8_21_14_0_65_40_12]PIW04536.1 MAG: gliding motility-associated protein GldE [Cytophagales bacterium CG17_big_fil_post_rev_8_21_14_2_50_40_13]
MESVSDDPYPSLALLALSQDVSTPYLVVNGVVFIFLVILSALISGSEVAFFSLSSDQIDECKNRDTPVDQLVIRLIESPRHLLATILIMNNLVNIAIVTLTTFVTWEIMGTKTTEGAIVVGLTAIVTFVILFFGEVLPKNFATQNNLSFARTTARMLAFFEKIVKPVSFVLIGFTQLIETRVRKTGRNITVDELNQALEMTTGGNTTEEEKGILKGIVNFSTLSVRQVMKSRMDITAVDIELDFHELMDKINKSGFSRIPVYNETIDKIEGILYIKDLLVHVDKDEDFEWQKLLRPGFFVPENKKVDSLLKNFQDKRVHMAIVVDEYGGTSGLITMEDIIEEIVGEINDEFDDDDVAYNKLDNNTYVFEGKTSLNDFCKILDIDNNSFEQVKGESESLGGLLLELHSKLPRAGEKIEYGPFLFTIVAVDVRRIKRVRVLYNSNVKV